MIWEILTGGSNGGLDSLEAEGTILQSDILHNQLQDPSYQFPDQYYRALAANDSDLLRRLKDRAIEEELKYPRYWKSGDNSQRTPKPEITSSWVEQVDYNPNTQLASIRLNGKDYTYVGVTPDQMERFLRSDSLGRVINQSKDPSVKKGDPYKLHGLKV